LNPFLVIIERKFDSQVLIDEVGHITINKTEHFLFVVLGNHEISEFLLDDGDLLIIIEDVDVGSSCQVAELVIEKSLELVVPG